MISSQTEVAAVAGDFILLGDTSDSNNLKKAPISSILAGTLTTAAQTNITSLGTLTGLTVNGAAVFNENSADVDFRVESNGNANMIFVDGGNDKVGIGTSSPYQKLHLQDGHFIIRTNSADADDNNVWFQKSRNATDGSHTVVQDGDDLGSIIWDGSDGNSFESAAKLMAEVDGTPGDGDMPGRLVFMTSADGAASPTERMRIGSNGRVGIGTTSARGALDVVVDHAVGYAITAQNDGNNQNRYGIKIIAGSDDGSGTSYFLDFWDGDSTNVGAVTNAGGTVSYGAFTAHHPCVIPDEDNNEKSTEPAYSYGTLLETTSLSYLKSSDGSDTERGIIYNVQKSSGAYSRKVLGAYGNSMNQGPEEETNKHQALILGDGHILCNNEKGNISVGDGICTSTTAGIGMKADKMAMIIGIAQEDVTFTGSETKLVPVQYGLQQFTPWT